MTTYLIAMLVITVMGIGGTSYYIQGEYPRSKSFTRSDDLVTLAVQVGMLVWIINLLLAQP